MAIGLLNDDTNLREGPGTGYRSRGLVGRGRRVEILDRKGGWLEVRVMDGDYSGKVGWMYADNVNSDR